MELVIRQKSVKSVLREDRTCQKYAGINVKGFEPGCQMYCREYEHSKQNWNNGTGDKYGPYEDAQCP